MSRGFTILEVFIVVAILAVLSAVSIAAFNLAQKQSDVDNVAQEVATVLKLAQSKTLASENDAQYGVYFDTTTSPDQYVLFKGASYASRVSAFDQITVLKKTVQFSAVNLGGGSEVVFDKLAGSTSQSGSIAIAYVSDASQTKTVYITNAGTVSFTSPATPSDSARTKDSRHVHIDYSRSINTATENVVLNFNNGEATKTLPIASNLSGGEFLWTGQVSVGGVNQTVTVATHRLNNPDTQFSVHRDMRYNTKSLKITLSGDASGNVASYSADGTSVTASSLYASNIVWQ